jgi:transmembrane sensor
MSTRQFQSLIEEYISGTITPEGTEMLRRFLEKPEHIAELESIMDRQLAGSTATADDFPGVVDRLKKAVEDKITEKHQSFIIRRLPLFRRWVAAAAAVVILAVAYLWFTYKPSKQVAVVSPIPLKNDVAPGRDGAILTLADGRTVVLDSLGNGLVAVQNGSKISLRNGQLMYDGTHPASAETVYNTVITPKGRQFQLVLSDGTKVWLNAASSLRYPASFTGKERNVDVTGEVYFEVAKNARMPFHVRVNDETEIEVLGTHFNVNSYRDEASINTTLLEGSVRILSKGEKAVLKPGQQAQAGQYAKHDPIKIVSTVNVEKVMAWKNGVFDFQDASLEEMMRQLERWYDIDVVYEKGVPKLEFIGKMDRDLSLLNVLRGLEMSEVHFRIEDRKLIVLP